MRALGVSVCMCLCFFLIRYSYKSAGLKADSGSIVLKFMKNGRVYIINAYCSNFFMASFNVPVDAGMSDMFSLGTDINKWKIFNRSIIYGRQFERSV